MKFYVGIAIYFLLLANLMGDTKNNGYEIDSILLANSYLDGGSIVIVATTDENRIVYIYSSARQQMKEFSNDIALIGNVNMLDDPIKLRTPSLNRIAVGWVCVE